MKLKYDKTLFALVIAVSLIQSFLGGLSVVLGIMSTTAILAVILGTWVSGKVELAKLQLDYEKELKNSKASEQVTKLEGRLKDIEDELKSTNTRISGIGMIKRG